MKTCPYCAEDIEGEGKIEICPYCKSDLSQLQPTRPMQHSPMGDDASLRMLLPVGRSGWAIAAGYLGLFSLILFPAPFAIVCGVLAIRDIKRKPKSHGMGRAIFGILMGCGGSLGLIAMLTAFLS